MAARRRHQPAQVVVLATLTWAGAAVLSFCVVTLSGQNAGSPGRPGAAPQPRPGAAPHPGPRAAEPVGSQTRTRSGAVVSSPSLPFATPGSEGAPSSSPGQGGFAKGLGQDQKSLDHGALAHRKVPALHAGAQEPFTVTITDTGKHPRPGDPLANLRGWLVDDRDVPAGGMISVTASCDEVKLKCEPESPARQTVVAGPWSGTWTWQLSALSPGVTHITLVVTAYDQNTQVTLAETAPKEITISIHATTSYRVKALAKKLSGLLGWIGPALLFAGAAATWGWYTKRRKIALANPPGPPMVEVAPTSQAGADAALENSASGHD
jgi:hypothetical protein